MVDVTASARRILVATLFLALGAVAHAQERQERPVRIPFFAEPVSAQEMQQRAVREGEAFMVQRYRALMSATLTSPVSVPISGAPDGAMTFAAGTRLIFAGDRSSGFYCGSFRATGFMYGGLAAAARTQWICFEDQDRNDEFEAAFEADYNVGTLLPSFNRVTGPIARTNAPYTRDAEGQQDFYEVALMHKKSFNIYGRAFIYRVGRRQGETEWSDFTSTGRGIGGGYIAVKQNNLPQEFEVSGAKAQLVEKREGELVMQPISAKTGIVALGVH